MKKLLLGFIFLSSTFVQAADIPGLTKLFADNFNTLYAPRMCGKNIERFIEAAQAQNINLDNAYVLKIVGGGFFETSGFYTRTNPNDREMLGYFHYVLVADRMVFDFDLNSPLVLTLENYARVQLSPPDTHPWAANWGKDLSRWVITRYDIETYMKDSNPQITWKKSMGDLIDVTETLSRNRNQCINLF